MKRLSSTLYLMMMAIVMLAIPAKRVPFRVIQSDGTQITLILVGDENLHYYENVATGEKMQRGDDGDYYVIDKNIMTEMRQVASVRRASSDNRRRARLAPRKVGSFNEMRGQKKGIVILVNYSDVAMTTGTLAEFYDMFNKQGYDSDGHVGSVADYFKDQSYGQFELSFDVVGPVTLSNTMAYYGGNDSRGNDLRPAHMAKEACQLVDSEVDFADYDWDGDGNVDQVFVIYAGHGENFNNSDPNTIWPHEWEFSSAGIGTLTIDGVKVNTYACCAELYGVTSTALNGIGTACHEFSHCLGYPDSYDTDYSGGVGMDSYDVMCGGSYNGPRRKGEVPAGYTAYERWMAGWLTPIELSEPVNVNDMPDLGSEARAYIIYNPNTSNEYFMLENRQAEKWFQYYNRSTAGHGLFITHIDYNSTVWNNNKPNDDPNHQRLAWVPADGEYSTNFPSDFFPGTENVTSFTNSSHTDAYGKWFNGTSDNFKSVTDIKETNGLISFKFDGGVSILHLVNLIDRLNRGVEGDILSDVETLVNKILGK